MKKNVFQKKLYFVFVGYYANIFMLDPHEAYYSKSFLKAIIQYLKLKWDLPPDGTHLMFKAYSPSVFSHPSMTKVKFHQI